MVCIVSEFKPLKTDSRALEPIVVPDSMLLMLKNAYERPLTATCGGVDARVCGHTSRVIPAINVESFQVYCTAVTNHLNRFRLMNYYMLICALLDRARVRPLPFNFTLFKRLEIVYSVITDNMR